MDDGGQLSGGEVSKGALRLLHSVQERVQSTTYVFDSGDVLASLYTVMTDVHIIVTTEEFSDGELQLAFFILTIRATPFVRVTATIKIKFKCSELC